MNTSIWLIDGTLAGITILDQSEPWSNSNERALHILQSSRTGASPSDGLVSYPGHLFYSFAKVQLAYSTAPGNRVKIDW